MDRTKKHYEALGFSLNLDFVGRGGYRVVQLAAPYPDSTGEADTASASGSSASDIHLVSFGSPAARA
jgi:hypothetical protein